MNKLLIILSILISANLMQMNHPLAMGLMLLIQTIILCLISGFMSQTFWFPYILFLIFLGGMLVLFIYVTSLASNEMFNLSTKTIIMNLISMVLLLPMYLYLPQNNLDIHNMNYMLNNTTIYPLIKLYNQPNGLITIMLAMYLFLTLIAVVKITNISKGPLRNMT
uniref:NADH dehydrogenase subunit 6 n=1 Tax=Ergaula nepalensis TaxID=3037040 RepID=UPI0027A973D1|nr:NADH dehydrogenase subunit 6 [Ergaula nepalensis]WGO57870.1 NADH dehydrogenase subunit 6 [Ergaula nepalensis]